MSEDSLRSLAFRLIWDSLIFCVCVYTRLGGLQASKDTPGSTCTFSVGTLGSHIQALLGPPPTWVLGIEVRSSRLGHVLYPIFSSLNFILVSRLAEHSREGQGTRLSWVGLSLTSGATVSLLCLAQDSISRPSPRWNIWGFITRHVGVFSWTFSRRLGKWDYCHLGEGAA